MNDNSTSESINSAKSIRPQVNPLVEVPEEEEEAEEDGEMGKEEDEEARRPTMRRTPTEPTK